VFDVVTDGTVTESDGIKTITWNKNLVDSQGSVSYTYSIPLEFPYLYALGKLEIDNGSSVFTEARNWYVAADPAVLSLEEGMIAYRSNDGTNTVNSPKIRLAK
jgi:hypothetical protein